MDPAPVMTDTRRITQTVNVNLVPQIPRGPMGHAPVIQAIRKITTMVNVTS
jgi:hypothetical protein